MHTVVVLFQREDVALKITSMLKGAHVGDVVQAKNL